MHDVYFNIFIRKLFKRRVHGSDGSHNVALDDKIEFLSFTLLYLGEEFFQC